MFNQFRVRYPNGSLISELLTINHGKYVVRALVQVEGVTLATGLAAAETVEMAEDQARSRVLAVLGISRTAITEEQEKFSVVDAPVPLMPIPVDQTTEEKESVKESQPSPIFPEVVKVDPAPSSFSEPKVADIPSVSWEPDEADAIPFADEFFPTEAEMLTANDASELDILPITPPKTLNPPSMIPVPSYSPMEYQTETTGMTSTGEPVDFSDIVARTNVELRRLGWTNEQGRDYLVGQYNKRSRSLLSDEELLEFLQYLESQTTPED